MTPIQKQIVVLEEKISRERAKLADAKAKAAAQNRKRDTRRKILFGYALLDWASTLPQPERKRILSLIHARLKKRERVAFPLREALDDVEAIAEGRRSSHLPVSWSRLSCR
ncbi:MAG TPA: hypothetical protein VIN05_06730 [Roseovarius sp.]